MMRVLIAFCSLFSIDVFAQQEGVAHSELAITSMLASLLLVIVCIFVFAYLIKKTNLVSNGKGCAQIKVVVTQPLTRKGRVQMIEFNGQQYLLGVTEQNITLLDKLDKPLITETKSNDKILATTFATLFSKISKKSDE